MPSNISCRVILAVTAGVLTLPACATHWPQYDANPFSIALDIPAPEDSAGGIVVADADNDGFLDYLVTVPGHVACYAHDGTRLWTVETPVCVGGSSERVGLPGHHGPGVTAGDVDNDGANEVLFLTRDSTLHVFDGASGNEAWQATIAPPEDAERWEHLVLASFRSPGAADILLQATNADGYRMGRYIAAFSLGDLENSNITPLWQRDDFLACAHNGARVADLDGDGRDEVLGGTIIGPDGDALTRVPLKGHIDSIFVYDVRPDLDGLEVVALEEGGGNRVFLYNKSGLIWETHYEHWEPQNAAVGEFDLTQPGLEIWCRSRFNTHQKPFLFNARGEHLLTYAMDDVAPEGWTDAGVEVIWCIDWTGEPRQHAAAKERHTEGHVCVFGPVDGAFRENLPEKAGRLFVADVSGDWREELVVLNGNTLHIYHNPAPSPNPDRPRLWTQPHYLRSKMTWNYYSP